MSYLDTLFDLKDKVVVVTGATGQIGTKVCKAYHKLGAKVIAIDIAAKKSPAKTMEYKRVDITDKREVSGAFNDIAKRHGGIDVLINNAGVSVFAPFEERTEEDFDFVMDVNLKGTFLCIQSYADIVGRYKMEKGTIINVASFYGVISPDPRIYTDCDRRNSEVYGATKAGVIQMTRYFAVHLADKNIRVNAISPGGIYNPDNPQGKDFIKKYSFRCPMARMGIDTELIGAFIYLSSDAASYTTGQNIIIDGGMSCW